MKTYHSNQEAFQIGAQSVLPRCVHFRIIQPANFSTVDNTCDVTWLTTKKFGQFEIKFGAWLYASSS